MHQVAGVSNLKGLEQTDKGADLMVRGDDLDEVDAEAWLGLIKGRSAASPPDLCQELDVTRVRGVYE